MIDVQYQMPDFGAERRLAHPLGIKDSGDWSQDGQSFFIDKVIINSVEPVRKDYLGIKWTRTWILCRGWR